MTFFFIGSRARSSRTFKQHNGTVSICVLLIDTSRKYIATLNGPFAKFNELRNVTG